MRTTRQALTDIAAICDDDEAGIGKPYYWRHQVRAVLADVEPESAVVLDRDAARDVLERGWLADQSQFTGDTDDLLDALEGCVRPAPTQIIDRDAFLAMLEDIEDGDHMFDQDDLYQGVLALLRPVDGVTLTREEAARAYGWRFRGMRESTAEDDALAARLEAAS